MPKISAKPTEKIITYPKLPLALYREIAAHLQQVQGIKIRLVTQSNSPEQTFDYYQSQVKGLLIEYNSDLEVDAREKVEKILDYYAQR